VGIDAHAVTVTGSRDNRPTAIKKRHRQADSVFLEPLAPQRCDHQPIG
jgi:hypothetical protein